MGEAGNNVAEARKGRRPRVERVDWIDVDRQDRSSRAIAAAVLAFSILFHAGLFFFLPRHTVSVLAPHQLTQAERQRRQNMREVKVHLVPPSVALPTPQAPKPPEEYVQSTDAPENKPDETPFFSNKNQQASQIIESKVKDGRIPEVANGETKDANALETGMGKQGQPKITDIVDEIAAQQQEKEGKSAEAKLRQEAQRPGARVMPRDEEPAPPLPKAFEAKNPKNTGKGIAEFTRTGKGDKIPDKVADREIEAVVAGNPYVKMEVPKVDASDASGVKPRPRPRLTLPGALPSLVRKSASGLTTPNGSIAFDTKLSEFGDYLSRVLEAISMRWYALNNNTTPNVLDSNTFVSVQFDVTKDGQVVNLKVLESNSSQSAQWRCLDAIQSNAPYYVWTKDMVTILGDHQPVRIQFIYR